MKSSEFLAKWEKILNELGYKRWEDFKKVEENNERNESKKITKRNLPKRD